MGLSDPWANSIDIIDLESFKQIPGIKPMDHSAPLVQISCNYCLAESLKTARD